MRHFEKTDMIMGLYVRDFFDPYRPDELIDKLIDRGCTIRQNINQPLTHPISEAPVNQNSYRAAMTLVALVTGYADLSFTHFSVILEPGEMVFIPPSSNYSLLSTSAHAAQTSMEEIRLVYAEYPETINYF